jgi:hypothetical protein
LIIGGVLRTERSSSANAYNQESPTSARYSITDLCGKSVSGLYSDSSSEDSLILFFAMALDRSQTITGESDAVDSVLTYLLRYKARLLKAGCRICSDSRATNQRPTSDTKETIADHL